MRFAGLLLVLAVVSTLTGKMNADRWVSLPARWQELGLLLFAIGMMLSIAVRIERAFAKQRKVRHAPENGGRVRPLKRRQKRQRGNRKRKGKV